MSFTQPPHDSRIKVDAVKAKAAERRADVIHHAEVHRALGRDTGPSKGRRLWRRFAGMMTGTRNTE